MFKSLSIIFQFLAFLRNFLYKYLIFENKNLNTNVRHFMHEEEFEEEAS